MLLLLLPLPFSLHLLKRSSIPSLVPQFLQNSPLYRSVVVVVTLVWPVVN